MCITEKMNSSHLQFHQWNAFVHNWATKRTLLLSILLGCLIRILIMFLFYFPHDWVVFDPLIFTLNNPRFLSICSTEGSTISSPCINQASSAAPPPRLRPFRNFRTLLWRPGWVQILPKTKVSKWHGFLTSPYPPPKPEVWENHRIKSIKKERLCHLSSIKRVTFMKNIDSTNKKDGKSFY